jgi:hypothetical protein
MLIQKVKFLTNRHASNPYVLNYINSVFNKRGCEPPLFLFLKI